MRQQCLTATCGPYQQNVGFRKLYIVAAGAVHLNALVVVVDRHGKLLFGDILTDHVLIEKRLHLVRFGQMGGLLPGLGLRFVILKNGVAHTHTLVTNVRTRVVGR